MNATWIVNYATVLFGVYLYHCKIYEWGSLKGYGADGVDEKWRAFECVMAIALSANNSL